MAWWTSRISVFLGPWITNNHLASSRCSLSIWTARWLMKHYNEFLPSLNHKLLTALGKPVFLSLILLLVLTLWIIISKTRLEKKKKLWGAFSRIFINSTNVYYTACVAENFARHWKGKRNKLEFLPCKLFKLFF